jgi:hypothetical protein
MGKQPTWKRTSVQSLLRNRSSGNFYGRWKISGKQKWINLKTDVFSVAKLRLNDEAGNYIPPGAKTVIKGNSATSVNRAIDTLRRLMDIAVERGAIHANPVSLKPTEGRLKKKVTQKKLTLPCAADVQRLFAAMENNDARGGWSRTPESAEKNSRGQ